MEEDIKLLLSYIETEVQDGKKQIMGNGVIVNGDAIINLIKRIRVALPIVTGENKVIEASQKAMEIIEEAEKRKANLIDGDIATKEARVKSEQIIKDTLVKKSQMEKQVFKNIDEMLIFVRSTVVDAGKKIQKTIDEVLKDLDNGIALIRSKIQNPS